jgi:hypothetical protein
VCSELPYRVHYPQAPGLDPYRLVRLVSHHVFNLYPASKMPTPPDPRVYIPRGALNADPDPNAPVPPPPTAGGAAAAAAQSSEDSSSS